MLHRKNEPKRFVFLTLTTISEKLFYLLERVRLLSGKKTPSKNLKIGVNISKTKDMTSYGNGKRNSTKADVENAHAQTDTRGTLHIGQIK